jgi:anaerobic magnesium-protoporphyrin IX monomethyl ester cyclase
MKNNDNIIVSGKRVLMLFPPFHKYFYGENWRKSESLFPPLGLLYIATPLVKAGYRVKIIDLQVDQLSKHQYFDHLNNSDYVLISCFTFAYDNIQKIIHDVKTTNPKARIICGGPYCNETKKHIENADYTLFGEADQVIVKLLESIATNKSLSEIAGLCYHANGNIIINQGEHKPPNLDQVDPPLFELVENKNYGYVYGVKLKHTYPLITSRGCPFKCAFCTFQNVKYRERSVENVIAEIKMRVDSGAKHLIICDDNFLLNKRRVNFIFDYIIENKLKIKIIIQGRIDIVDYELCLKMKQANVIMLIFGIENVNQDVLNYYNKKTNIDQIRKVIEITNSLGILTSSGVIIGSPIENNQHFENIIEFFKKTPQDFINVNILRYQYPSPLWIKANAEGLISENETFVYANEKLSNYTFGELLVVQQKIIRSFFNNPKRIIRLIYKLTKHLGILVIFKIIILYFGKSIYRPAQEFHKSSVLK